MPSSPSSLTPSGSPIAPMAVVSSPGITRTCTPVVSSRPTTASICSCVACGVITIIMGVPHARAGPAADSPTHGSPGARMVRDRVVGHAGLVFWRIAKLPLTATPWKDLAYITLGLASGCFALTWFFVGPVLSILLIITLIGIPKLYGDLWITRWWADAERLRGGLAGVPMEPSRRVWRGERFLARLRSAVTDPMTWRELVWLILVFGIGTASFVAGITAFS